MCRHYTVVVPHTRYLIQADQKAELTSSPDIGRRLCDLYNLTVDIILYNPELAAQTHIVYGVKLLVPLLASVFIRGLCYFSGG